ncbi:MAG: hypothetical protein KF841_01490 [Phycisphaerae bacterium]|nr:hypothetical protein [Phycisphaerae bacterium]
MADYRKNKTTTPRGVLIGGQDRPGLPRVLAYALPKVAIKSGDRIIHDLERITLYAAPLGHPKSFLDFDAIVLYAGIFEQRSPGSYDYIAYIRTDVRNASDLNRRDHELNTCIDEDRPIIFLVPDLPRNVGYPATDDNDLFRRFLNRNEFEWYHSKQPETFEAEIPEFEEYLRRHGVAHVGFKFGDEIIDSIVPINDSKRHCVAWEFLQRIFVLPAREPSDQEDAISIAESAVESVLNYRERLVKQLPKWTAEYRSQRESLLLDSIASISAQLDKSKEELADIEARKNLLTQKSDLLVFHVAKLLEEQLGFKIQKDDVKIQDASILDDNGGIRVVVEVKGSSGSFGLKEIGQVDSHRKRVNLDPGTLGWLIMNTKLGATSLQEKQDDRPVPDVQQRARDDNVLLIKTLDLLMCVDLIERGILDREELSATLLGSNGWLHVEDDRIVVE